MEDVAGAEAGEEDTDVLSCWLDDMVMIFVQSRRVLYDSVPQYRACAGCSHDLGRSWVPGSAASRDLISTYG